VNRWIGTIAYVGRETVDGRMIDRLAPGGLPAPIVDDGQEPVGTIETVDRRPDGTVYGTGRLDMPPGRYRIAVNLRGEQIGPDADGTVHVSGSIAGAFLLPEGSAAWPDAVIEVVEQEDR
jgi:hypothetical protein